MRICVFCGSHSGNNSEFAKQATELGKLLAEKKDKLVYGGANVGLMKLLAESFMKHGGFATGIIPIFLAEKHLIQPNLQETILVETMQERKIKMAELSDAFIALPGGYGTLEELFEITTASQLNLHQKPIILGNINGFYDQLIAHRDVMINNGFVEPSHKETIVSANNAQEIIEATINYSAPKNPKYIEKVHKKYNPK